MTDNIKAQQHTSQVQAVPVGFNLRIAYQVLIEAYLRTQSAANQPKCVTPVGKESHE